jgi:rRNA-processing protein FCF1
MLFGFANRKNVFEATEGMFPKCTILISRSIITELKGISKNKGKQGVTARLALAATRSKKIKVDDIIGPADDWIANTAGMGRVCAVITNDTELFRRLKSGGVTVFKFTRDGKIR